jgi:hypothetical protein
MGGSGGGGFRSSRSPEELSSEVQRELQRAKLESDVNALLAEQLVTINDRNTRLVTERLDEIFVALGEKIEEVDRLLYGGSVAKHTYVDGISDIDALVVLKSNVLDDDSPAALMNAMERALSASLDMGKVQEIVRGFAVTVRYRDGNEIQLLPAVERDGRVAISDRAQTGWSFIRPKAFIERLSEANRQQDGRLIPTVKLAKAIVDASVPEPQRPGGYHMEALAVDAFRGYNGPRNSKAMLAHFFKQAAGRIKRPIADVTGQSARIDETFGAPDSSARQQVSAALGRIAGRMASASNAEEWRELFE